MALLLGTFLGGRRAKRKARKLQSRANRLEQRRRAIANVAARRQALASLRRQQAGILAQSVATNGIQGGSAAFNAQSNIESQTTANVATQTQLEAIDQERFGLLDLANRKNNQAENFQAGFGLALRGAKAIASGGVSEGLNFLNPGG